MQVDRNSAIMFCESKVKVVYLIGTRGVVLVLDWEQRSLVERKCFVERRVLRAHGTHVIVMHKSRLCLRFVSSSSTCHLRDVSVKYLLLTILTGMLACLLTSHNNRRIVECSS